MSTMRVRVKFAKHGPIRFIGHLDVQRYFQKMNRRAGLDMAYSEGYSPHQLLSFAYPLSVGATSDGEYLDMSLKSLKDIRLVSKGAESSSVEEIVERMNAVCNEGIKILDAYILPEKAVAAMTAVAATRWRVSFRKEIPDLREWFEAIMKEPHIAVTKKTKAGFKEIDIKPFVYEALIDDENVFDLLLKSGSTDNVKPSLLMEALLRYMQIDDGAEEMPAGFLKLHRVETYLTETDEGGRAYLTPMIERDENMRIYLR